MRLPIVLVALLLFAALSLLTLAFALTVIVWPDAAGRRAVVVSFRQQWKRTFTPGDMFFPILSATGPALAAGWVVGNSDNAVAVSYVFVGASLMAVWTLSVFYTGWSLADEHAQGTLDLLITTRTPLVLIMFGKALGIAAWMLPSAVTSFLIVLAFSNRVTPVEEPVLLLVSGLLALASVIAFSFIFAPIGFLMGARGGFFNALMPLGTVLSGFLYPIDILPAGLELAARLLPAAWAMDAVVRSVNGTGETWRVVVDWAVASGLIAVLAILSVAAFQAAEKRVRVAGSLGTI
jgi:ABC-2 type transport system permease protein